MSNEAVSNALNRIPYGIFVLTSRLEDDMNAMFLNWFSQVSFEPQHVAVGIQRRAYSYELIKKGKGFAINIFNKEDADLVKTFSKPRAKDPEKFKNANYTEGPVTGFPILNEAAAYLECEVVGEFDTGSGHSVFLAKVVGGGEYKEGSTQDTLSLLDLGWSYSG